MLVKFNPTGTHVHKGVLRIRVDLYPEPQDDVYALQALTIYDRDLTQAEKDDPALAALVPNHTQLNPCLCHFIRVDAAASLIEVQQYVKEIFDTVTLKQLDSLLSQPQTDLAALNSLMKSKLGNGQAGVSDQAVGIINSRLTLLEVTV
ncbi:hypothetical protein LCGC14_0968330 [marine sediment metagenome]|uniref:Uncharacterized protein n=1 Tax=marine sediment metagenome TaxID=412755 RepID=A0A0F9RIW8_9ZZZZ